MLQHAPKHKNEKISVPKLSTALDKLNWLKAKAIITDDFYESSVKVTVHWQPKQPNASPSRTEKEK